MSLEGRARAAAAVLSALLLVLVAGGFAFYYAEGRERGLGLLDSLYWAFITATTIGYGDIYPETAVGRIAAMVVAVAGIAAFTALVGIAAEALVEGATRRILGLAEVKRRGHIVVLGYSPVTRALLDELRANTSAPLVVVDPEPPTTLGDRVDVVRGDILDEEALRRAGVDKASAVIIDVLDDSKALLTALRVRRMNRSAKVITLAVDESNVELMREAGARHVVPLSIVAMLAASYVYEPEVPDVVIDLASTSRGVLDVVVEPVGRLAGREFCEAANELLRTRGALLLGVSGGSEGLLPGCGYKIRDGDKLVLIVRNR